MTQMSYCVGSLGCIGALAGLSNQQTARTGFYSGMIGVGAGMGGALTAIDFSPAMWPVVIGLGTGLAIAKKVEVTELPEMVAAFHSLVGIAATATSIGSHLNEVGHFAAGDPMAGIHMGAIFAGT